MNKSLISTICTAFLLCSCSSNKEVITELSKYKNLSKNIEKIDVQFDNYSGKPFLFSITDNSTITEVMDIIFSQKLIYQGRDSKFAGDNTFITLYEKETTYNMSVSFIEDDGIYYKFSTHDLSDKIDSLAREAGAFENVE